MNKISTNGYFIPYLICFLLCIIFLTVGLIDHYNPKIARVFDSKSNTAYQQNQEIIYQLKKLNSTLGDPK